MNTNHVYRNHESDNYVWDTGLLAWVPMRQPLINTDSLTVDADITDRPDRELGHVSVDSLPADATTSGTITTNGDMVTLAFGDAKSSIAVQLAGTWTGQVVFESTVDGINWFSHELTSDVVIGGITNAAAGNGIFEGSIGSLLSFRVRANAAMTGTLTVTMRASIGTHAMELDSSIPAGANQIGHVVTDVGSVTEVSNGSGAGAVNIQDGGNSITVDGTVAVANLDVALSTRASLAAQTDGTQKAIVRGGAKGATTAADITSSAQGADHQGMDIQIRTSAGVPVDAFGGGVQYTEGDVAVSITGTAALMEAAGDTLQPLQGSITDGLLVNLGANNDVVVAPLSDSTSSGTLTNALDTVTIAIVGYKSVGVVFGGGAVAGNITAQYSDNDGTTWNDCLFYNIGTGLFEAFVTGASASQRSIVFQGGASHVRVRLNNIVSGSTTAQLRAVVSSTVVALPLAEATEIPIITNVGLVVGGVSPTTGVFTPLPVTGGSGATLFVSGSRTSGSSSIGAPVKIGGMFNTTQPTVSTAQIVDGQYTARGAQIVATGVDPFTVSSQATATEANPVYTEAEESSFSLDLAGNLRTRIAALVSDSRESYLGGAAQPLSLTTDGRLRVSTSPSDSYLDFFGDTGDIYGHADVFGIAESPYGASFPLGRG